MELREEKEHIQDVPATGIRFRHDTRTFPACFKLTL